MGNELNKRNGSQHKWTVMFWLLWLCDSPVKNKAKGQTIDSHIVLKFPFLNSYGMTVI